MRTDFAVVCAKGEGATITSSSATIAQTTHPFAPAFAFIFMSQGRYFWVVPRNVSLQVASAAARSAIFCFWSK